MNTQSINRGKAIIALILIGLGSPALATEIPNCTNTGNVENNVENGVDITGTECGILDDNIGTLEGSITIEDNGNLTINGNITLLKGNIEICEDCSLTITGDIEDMEGSITNNGMLLITGSITAAGKLEIKGGGTTTLDGGSFESTGNEVLIESGAILNLRNGSSITADSKINNGGTITSDGTGNSLSGPYEGDGVVPTELDCGAATCTDNSSLPIELLSFTTQAENSQVTVAWSTLSETNNHYFTVERSADGKPYTEVGQISGAGNSQSILEYSWVDHQPLPGKAYYRLRQTDYDGNFEVFAPSLVESLTTVSWSAYPNPAHSQVSLIWPSQVDAQVSVLTVSGQVMYQESHSGSDYSASLIDVNTWSPGVYFMQMTVGGKPHTQKLIIR
ncbi:MAG: T9SS type A sorting domain-containing protein [Bacteroidota bacterium]